MQTVPIRPRLEATYEGSVEGHATIKTPTACSRPLPSSSPYNVHTQLELAGRLLQEARNHHRANYYTSAISHAYQTVLHCAAGLLYGRNLYPSTEREVRIAFAGSFVASGEIDEKHSRAFLRLEQMRQKSDFDHDYLGTREEAEEALALAADFREACVALEQSHSSGAGKQEPSPNPN